MARSRVHDMGIVPRPSNGRDLQIAAKLSRGGKASRERDGRSGRAPGGAGRGRSRLKFAPRAHPPRLRREGRGGGRFRPRDAGLKARVVPLSWYSARCRSAPAPPHPGPPRRKQGREGSHPPHFKLRHCQKAGDPVERRLEPIDRRLGSARRGARRRRVAREAGSSLEGKKPDQGVADRLGFGAGEGNRTLVISLEGSSKSLISIDHVPRWHSSEGMCCVEDSNST
jgi:hypothetical protein